jgi:ABC-type antimicrobial peptide transport system permease subunit
VTTASDLASQVSGSLSSASKLLSSLGRWLSVAVIVAAVVIAILLTMSAVGRRVRELGTLKALGWRSRRVVTQIMGESLTEGVIGGATGVALGLAGAWLVTRIAPTLTATVTSLGGGGSQPGVGGGTNPFTKTIEVALHAAVTPSLALLAIGLAIGGGMLAGVFGGWRAARLRPADAMRQVV